MALEVIDYLGLVPQHQTRPELHSFAAAVYSRVLSRQHSAQHTPKLLQSWKAWGNGCAGSHMPLAVLKDTPMVFGLLFSCIAVVFASKVKPHSCIGHQMQACQFQ